MSYSIFYSNEADKILSKIPQNKRIELIKRISKLANNPKHYAKQLVGTIFWSLRCGDYRVILEISDKYEKVFIVTLDHRERIYQRRL